jgi:glucose/arabinose dehydrogenase
MRAQHSLRFLVGVGFACLAATAAPGPSRAETPLATVRVASGLAFPLYATAPPGDTTRLFIVERRGADNRGRIKILKNGAVLPRAFLTTAVLSTGTEQGLLGLAFAPDYAVSGRFYINYTRADGTTIIERHNVSADPDTANPAGTTILSIPQPASNHNGGWLGFGPDGFLYLALGDGGGAGDPGDRAQNLNVLLGKVLRIDVSGALYSIPPGNPFSGPTAGLDEIWAYGLRNPWRCGFDRVTGDLVIADVGQNAIEEVDFQPHTSVGGENYGWRCYEGNEFYLESTTTPCGMCVSAACPKVFPAWQYDHSLSRCSITGGYVYRGCAIPDLQGEYFFGDYCSAAIYSGRFVNGILPTVRDRTAQLAPGGGLSIGGITSFGEDARGELYICDEDGEVYKIVPAAPILESDRPVLRIAAAIGDTLGSTSAGNALGPGIVAFTGAGNRLRGIGYLAAGTIRDCTTATATCLDSRSRVGSFDVDLQACVDAATSTLTRRFIFTNRSPSPQNLTYVDVIAPRLRGDEDGATTTPGSGGTSPMLTLYDSFQQDRYIRHWGVGSAGVVYTADVDTAAQLAARIAADLPLAGGLSAGPATLALALGFAFGTVPPSAAETVTVFTAIQGSAPTGVDADAAPPARTLAVGPVPFRAVLSVDANVHRAGRVEIDVFDARGRRLRQLFGGSRAAGPMNVRWDGRDERGHPMPAGIYFVRYRSPGIEETRRAVRLR